MKKARVARPICGLHPLAAATDAGREENPSLTPIFFNFSSTQLVHRHLWTRTVGAAWVTDVVHREASVAPQTSEKGQKSGEGGSFALDKEPAKG